MKEIAPALDQAVTDLAEKKKEIEAQIEFVTAETTAYEERLQKDSVAIAACDEALTLLNSMRT